MGKFNSKKQDAGCVESTSSGTKPQDPAAAQKPAWSSLPKAAPAPPKMAPPAVKPAIAPVPAPGAGPTREQIAERAQAIWKASGCKPGRDEQNWVEAERQLKAEMRRR